ncbi:MAG TPA: hypothetical protein VEA37_03350, partial [Flavobacterium sp.]|nr:hypothetical protein [Flavobacterium sp.]
MPNDQLFDQYADIPALEGQTAKVLQMFDDVEAGIKKLSALGLSINTGTSAKQVTGLKDEFLKMEDVIKNQQKTILSMTAKLASLTGEEAKQIEVLKQVTALTKGLTAEQIKNTKIRQGEYVALQEQKKANLELNKAIQLRIKIRDAEEGSIEQLTFKYQKLEGIIRKLGEDQRNTARGQRLIKQAEEQKNKINELQKSMGNFSANVGRYTESLAGGFDLVAKEIEKLKEKAKDLQQRVQVKGFHDRGEAEELKKTTAQLDQLNGVMAIGFKVGQSYDKTVSQLAKSYSTLAANGDVSNEFLQQFKGFVAEAKDSAADLKDEIKALSSDTRQLDLAVGTISVMASGYEAAASAASLAGASTEETAKITQKLVAIQGVANGIREVGKQITERGTAANKIYNYVLQLGQTIMSKTTTTAEKLNATLKGVVILAVIGFLVSLVKSLTSVSDEAQDAKNNLEGLNNELERHKRLVKGLADSNKFEFDKNIANLKKQEAEALKNA